VEEEKEGEMASVVVDSCLSFNWSSCLQCINTVGWASGVAAFMVAMCQIIITSCESKSAENKPRM